MTQPDTFVWHPPARLFAGAQEILRPVQSADGFQVINAKQTADALVQLAAAIETGVGFCLHQGSILAQIDGRKDSFATLSGGTSGTPKVIHRSKASWTGSFEQNAKTFDYASSDAIAVLGALSHSLALYGVLEGLHKGLCTHALDMLSPSAQCARINAQGISILYVTPSQLALLCAGHRPASLPSVRLILCGGGALADTTRQAARRLCPNADIRVFYGAAETSFITLSDDQTPEGSVGRAFPGVDLRIGDDGEVWVKSPYLFQGYATSTSPDTKWQDGYLTVGENGTMDLHGNLTLRGRKARMVTIADQNIFLEEVETCISAAVSVDTCAVLALPDLLRGHRLIAILEGPENAPLAKGVRAACHHTLGPLATPKQVLFHPNIPRLTSGKPDLLTLARWAKEVL